MDMEAHNELIKNGINTLSKQDVVNVFSYRFVMFLVEKLKYRRERNHIYKDTDVDSFKGHPTLATVAIMNHLASQLMLDRKVERNKDLLLEDVDDLISAAEQFLSSV